jgi:VanZ family protein
VRPYLLPLLWMALIFAVSSTSNPPGQGGGNAASYAAHFTEFAILALLLARAIGIGMPERGLVVVATAAALIGAAYGLSDEWHQSFVAGRDASLVDASFDAAGALAGAVAWTLVMAIRRGGLSSHSA